MLQCVCTYTWGTNFEMGKCKRERMIYNVCCEAYLPLCYLHVHVSIRHTQQVWHALAVRVVIQEWGHMVHWCDSSRDSIITHIFSLIQTPDYSILYCIYTHCSVRFNMDLEHCVSHITYKHDLCTWAPHGPHPTWQLGSQFPTDPTNNSCSGH